VVHLCRRPLSESSVAANVLKHGTGAIHIDASRIGGEAGRWPANLVLQHREGCQNTGTRRVKAIRGGSHPVRRGGAHTDAKGHQTIGREQTHHDYADEDGMEAVDAWECAPGCPVAGLDEQTGERPVSGAAKTGRPSLTDTGPSTVDFGINKRTGMLHNDTGGASRFFKQVRDKTMADETHGVPADLLDYLYTLITPTHVGGKTLVALDPAKVDWSEHEDASLHGAIIMGDPSEYMEDLWRVLKPGAHVLAIAPEDQPTGHTGACALEDKGFEIRDAILWVQEDGHLHYVPKPAGRERHAGCEHLKLQKREEEAEETDDADVMDAEPAEEVDYDDPNLYKGNVHPTCKPRAMMERLLGDVPLDATVLDPFMGSGTTGLACLNTGHDFIGIEMEPDYIVIADARIRHWDRTRVGDGATIESEAPKKEEKREEISMDDFFGF